MPTTLSSLGDPVSHSPIPSEAPPSELADSFVELARPPRRSALEHFLDAFFQEKNIRWLLVIGSAIVFGSSLMLVTKQWSHWPSTIQFLVILGYTGILYFFGEVGGKRFGLVTTGKFLQGLTLLLLPVCFLSLSWFTSRSDVSIGSVTQTILLMIPAAALAGLSASRTFNYWLRERQTTFIVSYLLLCLAGVLPMATGPWMAAGYIGVCWLVMTAGVVKVNRHVFWLVEEHRSPRIFGFLPIGLLGAMFLLLVGAKSFHTLPTEWLGIGCVMLAATVLSTARSVSQVFRQRTGDLVRPLPWNLVAPMLVGLTLIACGVVLSFYGFSYVGPTTYAVVPTSVIAAALLFVVTYETRKPFFVWVALIVTAIAYQSTPTLISDLVQQFKAGAAQAISEERLPLAFYGATYIPFFVIASMTSWVFDRRKQTFFAEPIRQFVSILAVGLFVLAFGHIKAIFLVSLINILLFGW